MMPTFAPQFTTIRTQDRLAEAVPSLVEVDPESGSQILFAGSHLLLAGEVVVGRSGRCDLTLRTDAQVSRRHCRLVRSGDAWHIEDLGSTHGIFVDDIQVRRAELRGGEVIQIGQTYLRFERATASTACSTVSA